jgi:hypothetical protein
MEINDLRRRKEESRRKKPCRIHKDVDINLHYHNRISWIMCFSGFFYFFYSYPLLFSPIFPDRFGLSAAPSAGALARAETLATANGHDPLMSKNKRVSARRRHTTTLRWECSDKNSQYLGSCCIRLCLTFCTLPVVVSVSSEVTTTGCGVEFTVDRNSK